MKEVENGKYKYQLLQIPTRESTAWWKPDGDYTRVDMDGSTTQHNQGSIGGVARTKDGDWLWGFQ